MEKKLDRFLKAQEKDYQLALAEVKAGRKRSHWMWYIFPQIAGLGFSEMSKFYAIQDLKEAEAFLAHPILGKNLVAIAEVLVALKNKDAHQVFGSPDDMKLRSSMTLFASLPKTSPVFQQVLAHFFEGKKDETTLHIMNQIG